MTCVFGVDIIKGSPAGKQRPRYALFVLDDGKEEVFKVTQNKLFRLIRAVKPEIVALDNVSELFSSKIELVNFLKEIPASTKLVQVSGTDRGSLPLLSKRYGIRINIKSPADEAKACAYLASYGVGEEISVFFDKTLITVSRNRSLGKGGWRQNRYRRKVHDSVRRIFKEIKQIIDNLGFEYTEDIRLGYGGISKGTLLVNAPRSSIPINSFKTKDVQVKVEAVEKDKIEFIPLSKRTQHIIVGVDPGNTIGVAVLDLNGNILGIRSKKGWKLSSVIDYILSFGKPVVIATDKSSPPEYISKLRASFNAILYTPREDMSVEKKNTLTEKYKIFNDHERDALSAALDAFNSYRSKLRNIEKRIPTGFDIDLVKAQVIKGTPLKEILECKKEEKVKEIKQVVETVDREELVKKDRVIEELTEENKILKKSLNELKEEIEKLRTRIVNISREEHERVRKDNYIRNLESELYRVKKELVKKDQIIKDLENKLQLIKKMRYLEIFEGWKWVKMLKKFTKEEIERLEKEFGINENDIIFIQDASGGGKVTAEYLCRKRVRAVISQGLMSHLAASIFEENGVPVFDIGDVEIEYGDEMILINSSRFEEVYRKRKRDMERKKVDMVEKLFEDYKSKRKSEDSYLASK